jgi:hypothetical protein
MQGYHFLNAVSRQELVFVFVQSEGEECTLCTYCFQREHEESSSACFEYRLEHGCTCGDCWACC